MREIEFKGMDINGNWYYGLLSISQGKTTGHQPPKGYYISNRAGQPWAYNIRPETLGEYIGLKDDSDKKIYEKDIIAIEGGANPVKSEVFFEDGCYCVTMLGKSCELKYYIGMKFCTVEIVGNRFENPEICQS